MMRTYVLPSVWDAKKFASRYRLNSQTDFYVGGDGKLVVFPVIPDDPPIFELPDPPIDKYGELKSKLDLAVDPPIGPQIDSRIKAVLIELRKLI